MSDDVILDEEGEAVNSPMGLMCLGFAAGMHHGLEIARQMRECADENAPSYPVDKVEPQTWHPLET